MARIRRNFDSPWKEALARFLPDCLALFWPQAHAGIDWSRGYELLDKELRRVTPKAAAGQLLVDTLVKVWRNDGDDVWVLVHIEAQQSMDPAFGARMFSYHVLLRERFQREIVPADRLAGATT